jgi:molybdenum cofactor cytidylyltransferase
VSSRKDTRIAGLIVAAGGSSRLDSPKQLLKWGNKLLLNHVIDMVETAGIAPILVVLGSHTKEIREAIQSRQIEVIVNSHWEEGMSTSIKCGISALPQDVDGTFIFLSDQPFINSDLLIQIEAVFNQSGAPIAAPRVNGQQCNPVLFRRNMFPALMDISGDRGAKSLLNEHEVAWVDWPEENLLLDIDSVEDYRHALEKAGFPLS